ncbi:MAG TPA: DM13 domain-containing protein [Candidatus Nanopelagicales bacterium]|nr:DM13 domain-containing protein [Candidatus Nanopelagicales bacterium]
MSTQRTWQRPRFLIPAGVVASIILAAGLWAFQPWTAFIDVTVNDALPRTTSTSNSETASSATNDPLAPTPSEAPTTAPTTEQAPTPTAEPTPERIIEAEGEFISHEHGTTGKARIITLADGSKILRLVGLDTSNGPDLKVWLAAAPVIEGVGGWFVFDDDEYLSLGPLKGNKGNQNYRIPAEADISDLTSVTIWCERFSVSFGAAELLPA